MDYPRFVEAELPGAHLKKLCALNLRGNDVKLISSTFPLKKFHNTLIKQPKIQGINDSVTEK